MAQEYILGLDVGEKRIGVAAAHRIARLPSPLKTLERTDRVIQDVSDLVAREHAYAVVVGLPRGMKGQYTDQTRRAEAFAGELRRSLDVPVYLSDETLTSVQAEQALRDRDYKKSDVDALAAVYILDGFLQEHPEAVR